MSAAKPMDRFDRLDAYLGQYGQPQHSTLTPAQRRRIRHKANRALRTEAGREMTPRQIRWAGIRADRAARKAAQR